MGRRLKYFMLVALAVCGKDSTAANPNVERFIERIERKRVSNCGLRARKHRFAETISPGGDAEQ